jgi:DNA-binding PadR family transcriptional regulator
MNAKLKQQTKDIIIFLLSERSDYGSSLRARLGERGIHLGYDIYPILREMEREGTITTELRQENLAERGNRPRYYYKLASKV